MAGEIAPDAGVEVLVPLRLETRFLPPDLAVGRTNWTLQLRVYPDEVSMARPPLPPTDEELDRVDEALAAPFRDPPVDPKAAFTTLAAAVGAPRAAWLLRTVETDQPDPTMPPSTRRDAVRRRDGTDWPVTHRPEGLPPALDVWLLRSSGWPSDPTVTLGLDRGEIAADLDLSLFGDVAVIDDHELPETWWTSFARAVVVGLGIEIDLGPDPPDIEAIVVCGVGDLSPDQLFEAHAASGNLAILATGAPTNTVEGEPTTELGRDPDAWFPLVTAAAEDEPGTSAVFRALTGHDPTTPVLGGDRHEGWLTERLLRALWPVLWGRSLRDVTGARDLTGRIEDWALRHLKPEGPYPAVRVGAQPYGLLPATALGSWAQHDTDEPAEMDLLGWAVRWRDEAAVVAEASGTCIGADTARLLEVLGATAPSSRWGIRAALPFGRAKNLYAAEVTRVDEMTANVLGGTGDVDGHTIAPVSTLFEVPEELAAVDDPATLHEMIGEEPEPLMHSERILGLFGHLLRASLVIAHAEIGRAFEQLDDHGFVDDPFVAIDLDNDVLTSFAHAGGSFALGQIAGDGAEGTALAERFRAMQDAAAEIVAWWESGTEHPARVLAALRAVLDTTAFRVDPWIVGLADRRLQLLVEHRPFLLGAYGWVDAPMPFEAGGREALAPGPTAAGLLHAPSSTQALTAALLRDASVRHPGDDRWQLTLDSAKVRAAARLAERVRLGVHPYEALGLEVERLVGDWQAVRVLRRDFALRGVGDAGDERRCCDGRLVLDAARRGELDAVTAELVEPLQSVLDTYADLLVADGVHALVSGRGDLANAAMEAAAGLGAPPELRSIRTPRAARSIMVSAHVVLPAGGGPPVGAPPAIVADPAFAAVLDAELGPPSAWTWTVGGAAVSLADRGLHAVELLDLVGDSLDDAIRGADAGEVVSTGGIDLLDRARRLAGLLGGGEDDPPQTGLFVGLGKLEAHRNRLLADADDLVARVRALSPADGAAVASALDELDAWRIETDGDPDAPPYDRAQDGADGLAVRVTGAPVGLSDVVALRAGIRALARRPDLPVLPVTSGPLIPEATPLQPDRWLEVVAPVRPRMALLEATQLITLDEPWGARVLARDDDLANPSGDPWAVRDRVIVLYGPAVAAGTDVAIAMLDSWVDSVPSREHTTSAAFGFNGPKARPPQALLLAVPPDLEHRTTALELRDIVLETRRLARARAAAPDSDAWTRVASPTTVIPATGETVPLYEGWR